MSERERTIGLWGAVATLVGYVIGASIFVLPAQLMPSAGPGVFVAYLLAAIPAVFNCVVGAVIGSTLPVSGATYHVALRTISRFAAFAVVWSMLIAVFVGVALVAYGLADYWRFFAPSASLRTTAIVVVLAFGLLNLTNVNLTVGIQAAMVVGFLIVLLAFGVGGVTKGNWSQLTPLFPNGGGAVIAAAIPAYFSFGGLQVIIDIGGEVRDPMRVIPRSLFISFAIIAVVYSLVVLALPLLVPWNDPGVANAAMGRAAERIFPSWFARALVIGALLAAATSINGILLTQARDVKALAQDGWLPRFLAAESGRSGGPSRAVMFLTVLTTGGVLLGATIREYAIVAAIAMMVVQLVLGIAAWRIPSRMAAEYGTAGFRLRPAAHRVACGGLIASSLLWLVVGAAQSRRATGLFLLLSGVGVLYFMMIRGRAGAAA